MYTGNVNHIDISHNITLIFRLFKENFFLPKKEENQHFLISKANTYGSGLQL